MDLTWLEHVGYSAVFVLLGWGIGWFFCVPAIGFTFGVGFAIGVFASREEAQAEQRGIQNNYGNQRANAPWYVGFEPRSWNIPSLLDWFIPFVFCVVICIVYYIFWGVK